MFTCSTDITDEAFLRAIEKAASLRGHQSAVVTDVANVLDGHEDRVGKIFDADTPDKIIRSKMRRVHRRGLAEGCVCGCAGDFTLTPKGRELLKV